MSSRALRAGKAFIEFALQDKGVQSGLLKIERRLASTGDALKRVGGIGVAAGGAIVGALAGAVTKFAKTGDELNKMSARTGFAVQTLSELKFAAQQTGSDFKTLEGGIKSMSRIVLNAERGLSTATDTLDDLGLSVDDLKGKSPEELFALFADKISQVEDPTRRAALSMQVFGKSGQQLIPMLSLGSAGMAELQAEARALGITLSDDDAAAAAELTDALNRTWQQLMALVVAVGAAIAGPLTELLSYTKEYLALTIQWVKENQGLVIGIAAAGVALLALGTAVTVVGVGFSIASAAVGAFSAILGVVTGILASPVILIAAIVTALAALVDWLFLGGKGSQFLASVVKSAFTTIASFVGSTIQSVLGWLGDFAAGLLGLDDINPTVDATTSTSPAVGSNDAKLSEIAQEQQIAAEKQASELNSTLEDVANSVASQSDLAREANNVALDAAREEIPLLTRVAIASEQSKEILRRIERGASNGGLTFA